MQYTQVECDAPMCRSSVRQPVPAPASRLPGQIPDWKETSFSLWWVKAGHDKAFARLSEKIYKCTAISALRYLKSTS